MTNRKEPKYRGVANPALAEGMRQIRQSGKAGPMDNRPKRERSRDAAKRAAIQRDSE